MFLMNELYGHIFPPLDDGRRHALVIPYWGVPSETYVSITVGVRNLMYWRADRPPIDWATMSTFVQPLAVMKSRIWAAFLTLSSVARSIATAVRPCAANRLIMSDHVDGSPRQPWTSRIGSFV